MTYIKLNKLNNSCVTLKLINACVTFDVEFIEGKVFFYKYAFLSNEILRNLKH